MTTGEFAKAVGVTKDTLFHYDRIGLFTPELVMENEYRYYSIYQLEIFDTILQLKEMDMPLMEIKEFLRHRSPDKMLSVFQKRGEQIERQIRTLKKQKQWIEERMTHIRDMRNGDWNTIEIKRSPKRYYVYTPIEEKTDAAFLKKTNQIIMDFLKNNQDTAYEIGYLQKKEDIQKAVYDNYSNIILLSRKKPVKTKFEILEEGRYLTAYHKGHWTTVGECYERLLAYARKHRLMLDTCFFEYELINYLFADCEDEYVTEISVRIL